MSRIAQRPNQAVVRFNMRLRFFWSGGNGCPETFGRFGRLSGGEQIKGALVERFGGRGVGFGHGCY